jgi:hypothetical protein
MKSARLACLAAVVVLMTAANVNASNRSVPVPPAATPPAATVTDPTMAHAILDSVMTEAPTAEAAFVIEIPDGWCVLGWTVAGMLGGGGLGGLSGMTFGYLVC